MFDNGFGLFCRRLLFVVFTFPFGKALLICNLCIDEAHRTVQCTFSFWIIFVRFMDVYTFLPKLIKGRPFCTYCFFHWDYILPPFIPGMYMQCLTRLPVSCCCARPCKRGGGCARYSRDSHQTIGVCFRPIERPRLMHAPTACIQSQQGDTLSTLDTWPLPCPRLENKFTPARRLRRLAMLMFRRFRCHPPQLPDFWHATLEDFQLSSDEDFLFLLFVSNFLIFPNEQHKSTLKYCLEWC